MTLYWTAGVIVVWTSVVFMVAVWLWRCLFASISR